jgi:hypothetical protein
MMTTFNFPDMSNYDKVIPTLIAKQLELVPNPEKNPPLPIDTAGTFSFRATTYLIDLKWRYSLCSFLEDDYATQEWQDTPAGTICGVFYCSTPPDVEYTFTPAPTKEKSVSSWNNGGLANLGKSVGYWQASVGKSYALSHRTRPAAISGWLAHMITSTQNTKTTTIQNIEIDDLHLYNYLQAQIAIDKANIEANLPDKYIIAVPEAYWLQDSDGTKYALPLEVSAIDTQPYSDVQLNSSSGGYVQLPMRCAVKVYYYILDYTPAQPNTDIDTDLEAPSDSASDSVDPTVFPTTTDTDASINRDTPPSYSGGSSNDSTSGNLEEDKLTIFNSLVEGTNLTTAAVYMTGTTYNYFYNAGGGIVSTNGVFPLSPDLYLANTTLSTDGSQANIVQITDFDATPLFKEGELIFIYLLNSNNTSNPIMCGYIDDIRKTITGTEQKIEYVCHDKRKYLNQYFTPSFYTYTPPLNNSTEYAMSLSSVCKDVLNLSNIGNAIISLPTDIPCPPVEWNFEPIQSVLEWFTSYMGDYAYYIDRYGRLVFKKSDSSTTVHSFRIPTEGEAVSESTNIVSFTPITDTSRSRSRIILTGDFPVTEVSSGELTLEYIGEVSDIREIRKTGKYKIFIQSLNSYLYVIAFVPGTKKEIVDKLISDPNKSIDFKGYYLGDSSSDSNTTGKKIIAIEYYDGVILSARMAWRIKPPIIPLETFIKKIYYKGDTLPWNLSSIGEVATDNTTASLDKNWQDISYTKMKNKYNSDILLAYSPSLNTYSKIMVTYAYRELEPIKHIIDTGRFGGVEVIKRPEFKKLTSSNFSMDDTSILIQCAQNLSNYYKTMYGGRLELYGLHPDIELLDKCTITNTTLTQSEASNLVITSIEFDLVNQTTTLELTNNMLSGLPLFDAVRERTKKTNEELVKRGYLENDSMYFSSTVR